MRLRAREKRAAPSAPPRVLELTLNNTYKVEFYYSGGGKSQRIDFAGKSFPACFFVENSYNLERMDQENATPHSSAGSIKWIVFLAVGLLLVGWLLNTPEGLLGKADAVGYAVCHRIDARSFHLGDRQFPLCARCSGMYLGAVLGLGFLALTAPRRGGMPARRLWPILALLLLAFGGDGLNSYLHLFPGAPALYEPNNTLRLVTGTGMGLLMAIVLYPAFAQTVWQTWDARPVLGGFRSLLVLFLLAAGLDVVVLTENPLVLYPLALVSAGGVLVLLTMVYTMVVLMVTKAENRFNRLGQLVTPLIAGFGVGLLQIAVLDFVRFLFTGTWEGFHFG